MHIGPPQQHRNRYRCSITIAGRRAWGPVGKTPAQAIALAEVAAAAAQGAVLTIEAAIDLYGDRQLDIGNRPRSVQNTRTVLRRFFGPLCKQVAVTVTEAALQSRYNELRSELAVDSHRNYLAQAKTFFRWLVSQKILRANHLEKVQPMGQRQHGKPQLRLDEARRLAKTALQAAAAGDEGALAVLLALLGGLRAGEIVTRSVRDVDNNGSWLWIEQTDDGAWKPKSRCGKRRVELPPVLVPLMLEQCKGKPRGALLFPARRGRVHWRDWPNEQTQRLCELAGVPAVCAHSLRGLHATLAIQAGASPRLVADALGHEEVTTTLTSYAAPGVLQKREFDATNQLLN